MRCEKCGEMGAANLISQYCLHAYVCKFPAQLLHFIVRMCVGRYYDAILNLNHPVAGNFQKRL